MRDLTLGGKTDVLVGHAEFDGPIEHLNGDGPVGTVGRHTISNL